MTPTPKPTPPPSSNKLIAFGFDDGPSRYTPRLLDGLKFRNAKVTFFVLSNRVGSNAATIKRAYDEGHEIGNHSWNHPSLNRLSWNSIIKQISWTNSEIRKITGETPKLLRPPYGSSNRNVTRAAGSQGMSVVFWDVDPRDWQYRNAARVKNNILRAAHDGAIIVIHDTHSTSVTGALQAIDELKGRGYSVVTISEMFRLKGQSMVNGAAYRRAK